MVYEAESTRERYWACVHSLEPSLTLNGLMGFLSIPDSSATLDTKPLNSGGGGRQRAIYVVQYHASYERVFRLCRVPSLGVRWGEHHKYSRQPSGGICAHTAFVPVFITRQRHGVAQTSFCDVLRLISVEAHDESCRVVTPIATSRPWQYHVRVC